MVLERFEKLSIFFKKLISEIISNQEKVLAKKTFYFYECLMLESDITSIIPSNRFLKPEEFLNYIIKQLEKKDLKDDPFYNQIYNQIENHINKN